MQQSTYKVTPDFKNRVTTILSGKKFTVVFPFMNLVNRDSDVYNEQELNSLIQFIGDLPYVEVAEFFNLVPGMVKQFNADDKEQLDAKSTEYPTELVKEDTSQLQK
jgi:hypothetical protein